METNITASFKRKDDWEQAAAALKRQCVIEVELLPPVRPVPALPPLACGMLDHQVELGEEMLYPLNVYVEKSRIRQAEDTILQYGGEI